MAARPIGHPGSWAMDLGGGWETGSLMHWRSSLISWAASKGWNGKAGMFCCLWDVNTLCQRLGSSRPTPYPDKAQKYRGSRGARQQLPHLTPSWVFWVLQRHLTGSAAPVVTVLWMDQWQGTELFILNPTKGAWLDMESKLSGSNLRFLIYYLKWFGGKSLKFTWSVSLTIKWD